MQWGVLRKTCSTITLNSNYIMCTLLLPRMLLLYALDFVGHVYDRNRQGSGGVARSMKLCQLCALCLGISIIEAYNRERVARLKSFSKHSLYEWFLLLFYYSPWRLSHKYRCEWYRSAVMFTLLFGLWTTINSYSFIWWINRRRKLYWHLLARILVSWEGEWQSKAVFRARECNLLT